MRRIASQDVAKRSDPMKKPKYTPEIRDRAVQLLIEFEKDYPSNWAAIVPKIGCTPETLRVWYRPRIRYLPRHGTDRRADASPTTFHPRPIHPKDRLADRFADLRCS